MKNDINGVGTCLFGIGAVTVCTTLGICFAQQFIILVPIFNAVIVVMFVVEGNKALNNIQDYWKKEMHNSGKR